MASILVLHGPNLNLLGTREPGVYGAITLEQINQRLRELASAQGHHLLNLQSNAEHELIERIHGARDEDIDYIIINPAAFTHTSVAIRDALLAARSWLTIILCSHEEGTGTVLGLLCLRVGQPVIGGCRLL